MKKSQNLLATFILLPILSLTAAKKDGYLLPTTRDFNISRCEDSQQPLVSE